jgi:ParB-like chromosome segregation protein Spo0J
MMILKINEEYKQLLPGLTEEEYESLKQSISESGIRVKLQVLEDGTILCGHNRYNIAKELKIPEKDIPYEVIDITGDDNIRKYIIEDNLLRRQLNTAWKVQLSEKLDEIEQRLSKQRMSEGGRRKGVENLPHLEDAGKSRDKVAEKLGISGRTYSKAKKVKEINPKLFKKMLDGELTADGAYKIVQREEEAKKHIQLEKSLPDAGIARKTGTKEWSDYSLNINQGCEHNCKYCYARENALRYEQIKQVEDWTKTKRLKSFDEPVSKQEGQGMFPTTHDITPTNLDDCIVFLEKHLKAGNKILITSKPHLDCIKRICDKFKDYKEQILFRFTIGSISDDVLRFWEPNAPSFTERFDSLKYAFNSGFDTSVSCEPMLDKSISLLVCKLRFYVTQTIWVGKMNKVRERVITENWSNEDRCYLNMIYQCNKDEFIKDLYEQLKIEPKIRWKESIKEVVGLPEQKEVE